MKLEDIKQNDRILIKKGMQQKLIELAKEKSGLKWRQLSRKLKISESMLRNNLRYEKCFISFEILSNLLKIVGIKDYSKFIIEVKDVNWGRKKGGKVAGLMKKPATPKIKIKIPESSKELGEFFGILLGDGCVSKTNYSIEVFLNRESDIFYVAYVKKLFKKLFGLVPHEIHVPDKNLIKLRVNSKNLYNLIENFDMPTNGNTKRIPKWVLERENIIRDVIRGLFDTDGSLFLSSRRSILNFSSSSKIMINQVYDILNENGIKSLILKRNLNITSLNGIERFMELIGTSNTKNLIKFLEYKQNSKTIRTEDLNSHFELYKNVKVPFISKHTTM